MRALSAGGRQHGLCTGGYRGAAPLALRGPPCCCAFPESACMQHTGGKGGRGETNEAGLPVHLLALWMDGWIAPHRVCSVLQWWGVHVFSAPTSHTQHTAHQPRTHTPLLAPPPLSPSLTGRGDCRHHSKRAGGALAAVADVRGCELDDGASSSGGSLSSRCSSSSDRRRRSHQCRSTSPKRS